MKYLCAVGDSFIFGAELVTTHYPAEFANVSPREYSNLEFEVSMDDALREKYNRLLDTMRFTKLMADKLQIGHINFAQGGASQESIKFQAYLLMEHLKANNIAPEDTIWYIGLTMPSRSMMLPAPHEHWHDMMAAKCNDSNFVWSRYSGKTFFGDRITQSTAFTEDFTKEMIAATTEAQMHIKWALSILDTVNLLKTNKVAELYILNMFGGTAPSFEKVECPQTKKLAKQLLSDVYDYMIPGEMASIDQALYPLAKCRDNHPNKDSHVIIAEYILNRMEKVKLKLARRTTASRELN